MAETLRNLPAALHDRPLFLCAGLPFAAILKTRPALHLRSPAGDESGMMQIDKLELANLLYRISQLNIKRCKQQFLQIFIVVFEKEFYSLAIVFSRVKLPVRVVLYTLYDPG